jgi:putative DNA primase/helicase
LRQELSGILAWAVQGCLDWQRYGLEPPKDILDALKQYRADADIVQRFINDCLYRPQWKYVKQAHTPFMDIYNEWNSWCSVNRVEPGSEKDFS